MSNVEVSSTSQVLTIVPSGVMTRDRIIEVIRLHYPDLGARSTIWDFSHSDISPLNRQDFEAITAVVRAILPRQSSRKTAYVVADQASYVKACKYLNAAVAAGLPAEYAVFTSIADARAWLARP